MSLLTTPSILVLNKPFGVAVQGGSKIDESIDTMYPDCRLVHRLDRDTTGVLVLARTKKAAARLTESFKDRSAQKIYLALVTLFPSSDNATSSRMRGSSADTSWTPDQVGGVKGEVAALKAGDQGLITAPIFKAKDKCIISPNGLPAETFYKTLSVSNDGRVALVRFEPMTGRTHQIRVHALHMGFPLLGDPRYGDFAASRAILPNRKLNHLYLHAWRLDIPDPDAPKKRLELTAPLPESWPFDTLDLQRPAGID